MQDSVDVQQGQTNISSRLRNQCQTFERITDKPSAATWKKQRPLLLPAGSISITHSPVFLFLLWENLKKVFGAHRRKDKRATPPGTHESRCLCPYWPFTHGVYGCMLFVVFFPLLLQPVPHLEHRPCSQTQGVIFGLSCAGPGIAFGHPCGSLPTQDIL